MTRDPVEIALEWDGVPALSPLWSELARRMSASDRPVRQIRVDGLDEEGRRRLASLFGLPRVPDKKKVSVDVSRLASELGLSDSQLRDLVERVRGPIRNRAADREAGANARARLWEQAADRLGSRLPGTLARIRAVGVPGGDVQAHARLLEQFADAIDLLPTEPDTPLPMLALRVCGDPHGLDTQNPCGRYLRFAAQELAGVASDEVDGLATRRALRSLGVLADRLSTTTITYGLRARPDTGLGRLLEAANASGTPINLSGANLDHSRPIFAQPRWLCVENPSVVEAAALTAAKLPLVCTSGWPATDTQRLLNLASEQSIELLYAGDYDAEGLAIANWMMKRYDGSVVMSAAAYRDADFQRAPEWAGDVPETPWDRELAVAIRGKRRVVYQEDPAIWTALLEIAGAV